MKKRESVKTIMTSHVVSVREEDKLKDVVALFRKNDFRHLPVTRGQDITGIISSTDINRLTFGRLFENQEGSDEAILEMLTVPQVMTHRPELVSSDATVHDVAAVFAEKGFHALPVVDGRQLVGIVTTTDVIRYLLEQY